MVFHLATFFNLTNVSVQVILFPFSLVLRASSTFFGIESKRSARTMFILLILTLYGTLDITLQWWLLIRSKIFSNFSNRKTPSYWQKLISFNHLFSYNHLVSLHLKNWDYYLLAASEWLCKYICKLSIRSLRPLSLFQVIAEHCLVVHVIMSEHDILELANSVSNSFEYGKFMLGISIIYFFNVLDT